MARSKNDEKRSAILEVATRVIVTQGLSAPTAGIAKEAGVANGSLFTYFETKADLFNQLYLELKKETAFAAMKNLPEVGELRKQFFHIWRNLMNWAVAYPEKRRALAQLGGRLLEWSRANGPVRRAPMGFLAALMNSAAEATMDYVVQDTKNATSTAKLALTRCGGC